jgi:hypothetical protein
MLPTYVDLVPYPGVFTQNVQSWDKGICVCVYVFLEQSDFFFKAISYPFLSFFPLLMALFTSWYQKHVVPAISIHCCRLMLE